MLVICYTPIYDVVKDRYVKRGCFMEIVAKKRFAREKPLPSAG